VTQERIRELTKGMLRKRLYVVLSKGSAAPEAIAEHLPQHLEYMIGLENKGVLFASGPLAPADGQMRGDGLTIVQAPCVRGKWYGRRFCPAYDLRADPERFERSIRCTKR
jgi:hypothetical protein